MSSAALPAPRRRARQRRRRALLLALAFVAVLATTTAYWLASTGVFVIPISAAAPPQGLSESGSLTSFTSLSQTVTAPNGNAQQISGFALGKLTTAAGFANQTKVDLAWLDPQDAGSVLRNPHAYFSFGLYYPIHTGACSGGDGSAVAYVSADDLCTKLDQNATGKLVDTGQLIVSANNLGGFIRDAASDPSQPLTCTSGTSTWCAPSAVATAKQNLLYLIASISTPGGRAPGQQSQAGSLSFYIDAGAA